MRLTLKYYGSPESARVVTDKGEVIENVHAFTLKRTGLHGEDLLVIRLRIPRSEITHLLPDVESDIRKFQLEYETRRSAAFEMMKSRDATVNEFRSFFNMPPQADGDVPLSQSFNRGGQS